MEKNEWLKRTEIRAIRIINTLKKFKNKINFPFGRFYWIKRLETGQCSSKNGKQNSIGPIISWYYENVNHLISRINKRKRYINGWKIKVTHRCRRKNTIA